MKMTEGKKTSEKKRELHEMSVEDLKTELAELTEERFRLRFRSATESIENPMRFRHLRRDIARIKTLLQAREAGR
ncbi:MAG TPA: 50S ribosomal protein L29 [Gemmatimonadales bacterium]|nr:50S ribosomal protein L29 [Gemmatimonadales bacterium]